MSKSSNVRKVTEEEIKRFCKEYQLDFEKYKNAKCFKTFGAAEEVDLVLHAAKREGKSVQETFDKIKGLNEYEMTVVGRFDVDPKVAKNSACFKYAENNNAKEHILDRVGKAFDKNGQEGATKQLTKENAKAIGTKAIKDATRDDLDIGKAASTHNKPSARDRGFGI